MGLKDFLAEQKRESESAMAAFDRKSKEVREALSEAPYGFPASAFDSAAQVQHIMDAKLRERDRAKVGPVPRHATRKRRRRP